jgi:hypothetical protein
VADDVTLNSMSGGPVVATDDSGTGHVQIVKLAYSADGSRTPITADTNGLKVNVGNTVTVTLGAALPTGSNVIGAVTQSGTWNIGSITTLPALATGSNVIGAVTQSGTWNIGSITTLPALPTGSNTIGNVGVNGTVTVGTHGVTYPSSRLNGAISTSSELLLPVCGLDAGGTWRALLVDTVASGSAALLTKPSAGTTITDGSASVTTTAGAISGLGADATRLSVTLTNLGTDNVWIGTTTIAANRGLRLAPGQTAILDKSPTPAIWAVSSSGTQTVAFLVEK